MTTVGGTYDYLESRGKIVTDYLRLFLKRDLLRL